MFAARGTFPRLALPLAFRSGIASASLKPSQTRLCWQAGVRSRETAGSSYRSLSLVGRRSLTSSGKEKILNRNFASSTSDGKKLTFFQRFLGPKEMPEKWTLRWYREMALLCTVFGITGSSTMFLVRPAVSNGLGLEGTFKDGPWGYRIASVVIMTLLYATLLVIVGTTLGRHFYFRHFAVKMFSRFGIPPELMDKSFHETAKSFRKW